MILAKVNTPSSREDLLTPLCKLGIDKVAVGLPIHVCGFVAVHGQDKILVL